MTPEDAVKRQIDAINAHDQPAFVAGYAENCVVRDPQHAEPMHGRAEVGQDMAQFFKTLPDMKASYRNILSAGNQCAFQASFGGTNSGPLLTPAGEVPATNKRVEMEGALFVRINDQGLIVEEDRYFNMLDMMMQLGLMPGA